jgi:hypothetical protein
MMTQIQLPARFGARGTQHSQISGVSSSRGLSAATSRGLSGHAARLEAPCSAAPRLTSGRSDAWLAHTLMEL